ncbi:hypothetical protein [Sinomonas humi]|nr:hypothetical protein [Sinomonas humi]
MSAGEERSLPRREQIALRIRHGIRMAKLRVALDGARGRETPPAVVQLSQLPLPLLPSAVEERSPASREKTALRIRHGIRMAKLRVTLDGVLGRETPPAVVQLSQLRLPPLPSPLEALRSPEGRLRKDPESRRETALYLRRSIRAVRLRVVLDEELGRPTPEAVKQLSRLKLPRLE